MSVRRITYIIFFIVSYTVFPKCNGEQDIKKYSESDKGAAAKPVRDFIKAIDNFDLKAFVEPFTNDGTMFFPFLDGQKRVDGIENIKAFQKKQFAKFRKLMEKQGKTEPPFLNLKMDNVYVRMLSEKSAVVTWYSPRPAHLGRRTAAVVLTENGWKIKHYHASNLEYDE